VALGRRRAPSHRRRQSKGEETTMGNRDRQRKEPKKPKQKKPKA
jgi:hypothetical protein